MAEVKFGFIPGIDSMAYRVRRRYRLQKGGHPQLVLVHYSRGQANRMSLTCFPRSPVVAEMCGSSDRPGHEPAGAQLPPPPRQRARDLRYGPTTRPEGLSRTRGCAYASWSRASWHELRCPRNAHSWKPTSDACAAEQQHGGAGETAAAGGKHGPAAGCCAYRRGG